jgi:YD repeat-containing protein
MKTRIIYPLICLLILINIGYVRGQNTGPVAPEAMSFEPVDAANMVNLITGDLVYSIPILNIPGPGGGYPIALSYHGGIAIDQEASWVGLGWNINPGAISRGVIGYPDDFLYGWAENIIYNDQGTYTQRTLATGITIDGIAVGNSLTWNSNWSKWTFTNYVGIGLSDFSANVGVTVGTEFGVNAGVGVPGSILYVGVGVSTLGVTATAGIGPLSYTYNFTSGEGETNIGINFGKVPIVGNAGLDISISSSGNVNAGFSLGAANASLTAKTSLSRDNVYSSESSWYYSILVLSLGYQSTHFWYFDKKLSEMNGMLYLPQSYINSSDWRYSSVQNENFASDVNVMPYSYTEIIDKKTTECFSNLMLPASDCYMVNAQGLNGDMSLKYYEPSLLVGQTKVLDYFNNSDVNNSYDDISKEVDYMTTAGYSCRGTGGCSLTNDELMKQMSSTVNPYFYFENSPSSSIQVSALTFENFNSSNTDPLWGDYKLKSTSGSNYKTITGNAFNNRKVDGNFVQYFTNNDIYDNFNQACSKGFLETESAVMPGVKRSYSDFPNHGIGAFSITSNDGITYHYSLPVYQFEEYKKNEKWGTSDFYLNAQYSPYAFTWLLTGITGPDYVDLGEPGYIDQADLGYWVKFEYGKWTDAYFWKTPFVSNETEHFGRKQIYYLDKIETKTHEAYFIKEIRNDAADITYKKTFSGIGGPDGTTYMNNHPTGWIKTVYSEDIGGDINFYKNYYHYESTTNSYGFDIKQTFPLKLNRIILVKKGSGIELSDNQSRWASTAYSVVTRSKSYNGVEQRTNTYLDPSQIPSKIPIATLGTYLNCEQCNLASPNSSYDCGRLGTVTDPVDTKNYLTYYDDKVLDINDYNAQTTKPEILKEIRFNYDNENALIQNAPNSPSGKLTLSEVAFLDGSGKNIIPPYELEYYKYDNDWGTVEFDNWGYDKNHADNWSLKNITTPTGAVLNIKYGSDSYTKEAVFNGIHEEKDVTVFTFGSPSMNGSTATFNCTLPSPYTYNDLFSIQRKYFTQCKYTVSKDCIYECFAPNPFNPGTPLVIQKSFSKSKDYDISEGCTISPGTNSNDFKISLNYHLICELDGDWEKYMPCVQTPIQTSEGASIQSLKIKGVKIKNFALGGGCRVEQLSVTSPEKTITTNYSYNIPGTQTSSGVTSYEPGHEKEFIPYPTEIPTPCVYYNYVTISNSTSSTVYEFEVPASSSNIGDDAFSMGDQFAVSNPQLRIDPDSPFVPNSSPGGHQRNIYARSAVIKNKTSQIGRINSIKNYNLAGDLQNTQVYDYYTDAPAGANQETYYYLKDVLTWGTGHGDYINDFYFVSTSKLDEPCILKTIHTSDNKSTNSTYYSNFDLSSGIAKTTNLVIHNQDPEKTGDIGNISNVISSTRTEIVPAYSIQAYKGTTGSDPSLAGMGSKVYNIYNKNMLTQQAASLVYKKINGADKPIGATIQTWSNSWNGTYVDWNSTAGAYVYNANDATGVNIWRKQKSFSWNGSVDADGTYGTAFAAYDSPTELVDNWTSYFGGTEKDKWVKTSEVTRYNHFSAPMEVMDINGDKTAFKMDFRDYYTIAKVSNSNYASFTATSFEQRELKWNDVWACTYNYGGEVVDPNRYTKRTRSYNVPDDGSTESIPGINAHTGNYYIRVPAGQSWPKYTISATDGLMTGMTYRASVWVHTSSNTQNGIEAIIWVGATSTTIPLTSCVSQGIYGSWKLLTLDFDVPSNATKLEVYLKAQYGDNAYFDDFRFSPYKASVNSYTYDKSGNVTAILNSDNMATKYDYDGAGRLLNTYRETPKGFEKVNTYKYNFDERFSVDPDDAQTYTAKGQKGVRFNVSCVDPTWSLTLPSWITLKTKGSDYFIVDVNEEIYCGVTHSDVISLTSAGHEVINIPVSQETRKPYNINSPGDLTTYHVGSKLTINYDVCMTDFRKIEIYRYNDLDGNNEMLKYTINATDYGIGGSSEVNRIFDWTIPAISNPNWYNNEPLKVRYTSNLDPTIFGESGYFYIDPNPLETPPPPPPPPTPVIVVNAPATAAVWNNNCDVTVSWTINDIGGDNYVHIYLRNTGSGHTTDLGKVWKTSTPHTFTLSLTDPENYCTNPNQASNNILIYGWSSETAQDTQEFSISGDFTINNPATCP